MEHAGIRSPEGGGEREPPRSERPDRARKEDSMADELNETELDETAQDHDEAQPEAAEGAEPAAGEAEPETIDDRMFDKVNRAARLLRNRKAQLAQEAEAEAERQNNLVRALKLLELKPQMEEREMADLLGMRLRELDRILSEAEKHDMVSRVEPEDGDMRHVVVRAAEDAVELAEAQGAKRKKYIPTLSGDDAEALLALLDKVIEPLQAMGLEEMRPERKGGRGGRGFGERAHVDRGRRGSFGPRTHQDRRDGRGGFAGNRGGFGGRGNRDRRDGGFGGNRGAYRG